MKRLAILFLLTIVLASAAFAIEGVGNIGVGATVEATDVANSTRRIGIDANVSFSRDLIEGLNLYIGLDDYAPENKTFDIPLDSANGKAEGTLNYIDVILTYGGLEVGPGTLGFYLRNRNSVPFLEAGSKKISGAIRADVNYALPAGPGTLSFGLYTGFGYTPDFAYNDLGFDLAYSLTDLGLSIGTSTWFTIVDAANKFKFDGWSGTYINIKYAQEAWGAGLEVDYLAWDAAGSKLGAFPLKPYFEYYALAEGLTLGGYVTIGNLNGTGDITVSPGVYAAYSF